MPYAAATDSRGRYEISGLPVGRVTLTAESPGYYTLEAGGLASRSIVRSCPAEGDCPATDFALARGAVIEGWLTDDAGDPLPGAQVSVRPMEPGGEPAPPPTMGRPGGLVSDDRGYFRVWGLPPGRYEVTAYERAGRFGGPPREYGRSEVAAEPGGEPSQVRLSANIHADTFTVSGRVTGVEQSPSQHSMLAVEPLSDGAGRGGIARRVARVHEGAFVLPELTPGRYLLRLMTIVGPRREMRLLGDVTVDGDIRDLTLSPLPPTGVRGRAIITGSSDKQPFLRLTPDDGRPLMPEGIQLDATERTFEHDALHPGRWKLESAGGFYVVEPRIVEVSAGGMTEIEVRLSSEWSALRGAIRLREGERLAAASHFTVGVRGEGLRRGMQTDDEGGFAFEMLMPGDYEIAAWSWPNVNFQDDAAWLEVADHIRKVTLEPGFEMEIDVTATGSLEEAR